MGDKKRTWQIDFVKVIAIIMVLYNHLYCYNFISAYKISDLKLPQLLLMIPSCICKCGPPLFFMASGVVLLGKNESYEKILKHRVSRILIVMVAISVIKGVCGKSLILIAKTFMGGLNWYLYAYLAFLLMLPIYRRIAQNFSDNEWKWYIVAVIVLNLVMLLQLETNKSFFTFSYMVMIAAQWASSSWHIFFPLLGYGLYHKRNIINKKYLYLGAGISVLGAICLIIIDKTISGGNNFEMINQFFNVLPSCAIFVSIINLKESNGKATKIIEKIALKVAPLTFGMFLIDTHTSMRERIYSLFFKETVIGLHGVLAAWWILLIIFIVYAVIIWGLRLIPAVKKVL